MEKGNLIDSLTKIWSLAGYLEARGLAQDALLRREVSLIFCFVSYVLTRYLMLAADS